MYEDEYIRINANKPSTSAYYNEYLNSNPVKNGEEDYRKYLTRSLLGRGFLFYNSKRIEDLYKERVDRLYKEEFKKLFLYDPKRIIKDVYTDVNSVVNMNVIGYYDFMSSLLTPNTAKYFKLIEPFTSDDFNVLDLIADEGDEDSKKLILAEKLDTYVMDSLHQCVENIRIISTYPLHTLINATVSDKDNVNFRNMQIVYNSIDRVFTLLALYFSVKDLIGDISPIFQSYIKTIDNLKNMNNLTDMFDLSNYFSKNVLDKFIDEELRTKYTLKIIHPMFDIGSDDDPTSGDTARIIISYCENAINLRYLIRENVTNESEFELLFGVLLAYTNIFIQTFYIKSYISLKEPGGQIHVKDMFRSMNPIYETTVTKETAYNYIKEVINRGD